MKKCNSKSGFSLVELSVVIIIIGILVAGIAQGKYIISESRLKSALSLTASSPVNVVADIAFWIDATDAENLATGSAGSGIYNAPPNDGDFISNIRNRSSSSISSVGIFSASSNSTRPLYVENGIGGLPTMQFDGIDDSLIYSDVNGVFSNRRKHTVIMVFKKTSSADSSVFRQASGCAGANIDVRIDTELNFVGCGGSQEYDASGTGLVISNSYPYSVVVRINKINTTNQVKLYVNKATFSATPDATDTLPGEATIGSGGMGYYFSGQISEVIAFNRDLTDIEIDAIQNYLSKKYSIKM